MIYFVGAGPGDPELISVKGHKLLQHARCIVYAGSLVNPELLKLAPDQCPIFNSAQMHLEEIVETLLRYDKSPDDCVVRLHTGDPSLFGAIQEQMRLLDKAGHSYKVIPGISSFTAAAASLKTELTLPELSQTVVISRVAGATPVPSAQGIANLARLDATYCFFLSVALIDSLEQELIQAGLDPKTPAALVYKASWKEEKILRCSLDQLAHYAHEYELKATTMILVGKVLGQTTDFEASQLYNKHFSHACRKAVDCFEDE